MANRVYYGEAASGGSTPVTMETRRSELQSTAHLQVKKQMPTAS